MDFLLVLTISICFSSCEDEPEVSIVHEVSVGNGEGLSFYGKAYELVDLNRLCNDNKAVFRVTKNTKIIESADRCDRCDRTWYNHRKAKK